MGYINVISQTGKKYKINDVKEIARGGEGTIFEVDSNTVAKIYHAGIDPLNQLKFDYLKKLDKKLFVAPQELLFDAKSNVVGFTMEYLNQSFYPLSNIYTKAFCTTNGVDKKIKLKIIDNLIKAVDYAHKLQVVIGDLNCFNIMVNNSGDIKLIDTDSYQVPGMDHSGRLLDDIRDFLYQGRVSEKSDCFALSILAFNMLSFTHPFKGIHKQYIKISDRMIHKIPVFAKDPDLKVPKCYEPIQDANFMGQFQRFYMSGERFLMSLTNVNPNLIVVAANQSSVTKTYEQGELTITYILGDSHIKQVHCAERIMVVETEKNFLVYDTKNKGYVTFIDTIAKTDYDQAFVGKKNILFRKDKNLFIYSGKGALTKVTSIVLPDVHILKQYEDILVVIGPDNMYKIFIDETLNSVIKMYSVSVYGKGFQTYNSLIYNSGSKQNIFYNEPGKDMSLVSLPLKINDLYQQGNVGIIQTIENKTVKHKFFKIKNLKLNVSQNEIQGWSNFAFRLEKDGEGFIFIPQDDVIKIVRTQDFAEISELKCDLVSSESTLKTTNAGLILLDNGKVWLLNKK